MRFFSKFAFICNLCFIVTVVIQCIDTVNKGKGNVDVALPLGFFKGPLVILGFVSLLVSAVFCFFVLVSRVAKSQTKLPRWIVIFNFIALLAEIYWFLI
jgi:uncharacterized integral membrane protein